jgi:galactose mutarotase-like enzyme
VLRTGTRLPLVVERRMRVVPNAPTLQLDETVTNIGSRTVRFLWGHHPVFAVEPGMVLDAPPGAIYDAGSALTASMPEVIPAPPFEGLFYLPDRDAGWIALRSPNGGESVAMSWDTTTFRHVWVWFELEGPGFPWYGRARMIGLEPHAAWPRDGLGKAIERDRHLALAAGETRSAWLTLTVFEGDEAEVNGMDRNGTLDRH